MVSDDTEHACMTAQALAASGGVVEDFTRRLAGGLLKWFLALPAGIGLATLRAVVRLLLFVPPAKSGVFSAGNGPAMRAPIIGVCFGGDPEKLRALIWASTTITHTDPKARWGALAAALAAHMSAQAGALMAEQTAAHMSAHEAARVAEHKTISDARPDGEEFIARLEKLLQDEDAGEFIALMKKTVACAASGIDTATFADSIGLSRGVGGYIYHTTAAVIHEWLRRPRDFRGAVTSIIALGGDTDTTAAILGGIIGAGVGKEGIPREWISGICDRPLSVRWIERLSLALHESLCDEKPVSPPSLFYPFTAARNFVFLLIVLAHGFRRLLPPY
jgi:ADP-ribosylglycohydrolase